MKLTNIILAALLVVQGIILLINPGAAPSFSLSTVKMYDNLKAKDVGLIKVSERSGKNAVTLKKEGKKWVIVEAHGYEADKSKVDEILSIITKMERSKEVSTNKGMFTSYHLADDNVELELSFSDGAKKPLAQLLVGKSVIRGTFLRKKGGDRVYSIPASISGFLFTSPTEYMSNTSLNLPMGKKRQQIKVTYKGDTLTFKKIKEGGPTMGSDGQMTMTEDKWGIMSPEEEVETTFDATEVANLVGSFDNLMFDEVQGKKGKGDYGFATPHIKVVFKGEKGKEVVMLVGKKVPSKKDHRYLSITGSDFIYSLDAFKYQKWEKERKVFVKAGAPAKKPFGENGKLPEMKLPDAKLNLKVPGVVDPKTAKEAVIRPGPAKAPTPPPAAPAKTPKK